MAQTPEQIAKNWSSRLASSTAKIQAGVENVNVAPGQMAARQKELYKARVQERADVWAKNVAGVSLSSWQQDMVNKGIPRIATGATNAEPKFAKFMGNLLPYIESGQKQLPARGNLDQNIARMTQWVRHMSKFQNK